MGPGRGGRATEGRATGGRARGGRAAGGLAGTGGQARGGRAAGAGPRGPGREGRRGSARETAYYAQESSSSNNCLGMLQKMKPKQLAQPEKPGLQLLTGSAGSAPGVVSLPLTDEKQSKLEEQPLPCCTCLQKLLRCLWRQQVQRLWKQNLQRLWSQQILARALKITKKRLSMLLSKKACSKQGLQEACLQAAPARKVEQDCQNCSCTK